MINLDEIDNQKKTGAAYLLESCYIDPSIEIDRPPSILSIMGYYGVPNRLFTLSNFSAITGKQKSKKTFLTSIFTAAILYRGNLYNKFVSERQPDKQTVLYFDTEQGSYDALNVVKRIEKIGGNLNNFYAYELRPYTPMERCEIIEAAFLKYGQSICYCTIDGIADLANAINDELEATRIATMLMRLTKEYNCHINTVIHQNKNDNFATGHIGSAIMKKAEIVISSTKSTTEKYASEISCTDSRGADFDPFMLYINTDGMPELGEIEKGKSKRIVFYDEQEPSF